MQSHRPCCPFLLRSLKVDLFRESRGNPLVDNRLGDIRDYFAGAVGEAVETKPPPTNPLASYDLPWVSAAHAPSCEHADIQYAAESSSLAATFVVVVDHERLVISGDSGSKLLMSPTSTVIGRSSGPHESSVGAEASLSCP
jgi:hypothetical protein